jgi:predicted ATP-grasp superfamily ATP-dependent carboligase
MMRSIPKLIEQYSPQAVVLGPGLEEAKVEGTTVLNNDPEKMALVSDKLWQSRWLERNGFLSIKTETSIQNLRFPLIAKPRRGAGGVGCRLAKNAEEIGSERETVKEEMIFQEYILGRPASVSVISDGIKARAIAANEQLIGEEWTGAEGFRYCGNITPLTLNDDASKGAEDKDIERIAEEIVKGLGLVGSNGVDFLLTENGPVVVEVNARFQGSLDCVEEAFGINIFQMHLDSILGKLPDLQKPIKASTYSARALIYAPDDITIDEDLSYEWTKDVPRPGSRIKKGDPVMSIYAKGKNRDEAVSLLKCRAEAIQERIKLNRI